jgi:uncharacterized protein
MIDLLSRPWPWYVAGPLIGLMVPLLLWVGNRSFGISSNFRHACAACLPGSSEYLRYDWRQVGGWQLAFAAGVMLGGAVSAWLLVGPESVAISAATRADLAALGLRDLSGLVPADLFSWESLLSWRGLVVIVGGGFLVGFGTAYAAGCTSGHGVTGLASFQLPSLIAVFGFFAGGLVGTWVLLPLLL